MNPLQKVLFLFVATIFLVAMGADRHHNLESFVAEPVGDTHNVTVRWTVVDAALVSEFELTRKRGNSTQRINGCSSLSGNTFQCVDSDLYKGHSVETTSSENITYILRARHHNDARLYSYGETVVEYTTNAVRRTWGSIKSMFQ